MANRHRISLAEFLLITLFGLAIGYLGWIGWALNREGRVTPTPAVVISQTPLPTPTPVHFDGQKAYWHVVAQVSFGPRVPGSEASRQARAYIRADLANKGWRVEEEAFTFREVPLANIVARRGQGPITLLGAHYDSRPRADRDPDITRRQDAVPGANDGASGVAVLLELARVLRWNEDEGAIWLYFFDAEDSGNVNGWPWSVGARHAVQRLAEQGIRVDKVIILDMVGDKDQQFYWEKNSDPTLQASIWRTASELGYENVFIPEPKYQIIDDHVPFIEAGMRAIDIIDFDYPYWHTLADTPDKVSAESLRRVGHVIQQWLPTELGP